MSCYTYQDIKFRPDTLALISVMNGIITSYTQQGYTLSVRQLYYQLVARAYIPNTEKSYKRITGIANDARMAGLMDWDAIEDRTRDFVRQQRWDNGEQILKAAADSYHMDMWEGQDTRVFVIVEKEALVGVLQRACHSYDVPLLAARGYPSGTVLREFCIEDIRPALDNEQDIVVLHLGDHDPSGIDMSRDLQDRISIFSETSQVELRRIALTMAQINAQNPPPNPAKTTDSRFEDYRAKFGDDSWELDALPPQYLDQLVRRAIAGMINDKVWKARQEAVDEIREKISEAAASIDQG